MEEEAPRARCAWTCSRSGDPALASVRAPPRSTVSASPRAVVPLRRRSGCARWLLGRCLGGARPPPIASAGVAPRAQRVADDEQVELHEFHEQALGRGPGGAGCEAEGPRPPAGSVADMHRLGCRPVGLTPLPTGAAFRTLAKMRVIVGSVWGGAIESPHLDGSASDGSTWGHTRIAPARAPLVDRPRMVSACAVACISSSAPDIATWKTQHPCQDGEAGREAAPPAAGGPVHGHGDERRQRVGVVRRPVQRVRARPCRQVAGG